MLVVHFFENKNHVLSQLLKSVPSEGEHIKIKGRKGKVVSVQSVDENKFHVQVSLEVINKTKLTLDPSKKKKR